MRLAPLIMMCTLACNAEPGAPAGPRATGEVPAATGAATSVATSVAPAAVNDSAQDEGQVAPTPQPATPQPAPPPVPAKAKSIELAFVGDVIFGRYRDDGFDPIVQGDTLLPFAAMQHALDADLTIANLETPLVHELPIKSPSRADYRFGASRQMAQHLVEGGFDVVSLANNHHNDQREPGHEQTLEILAELGITAIGKPQPAPPAVRFETVQVKGWRIAFAAITTRLNMPLGPTPPHVPFVPTKEIPAHIQEALAAARADHDLVVVSLHWGEEYTDKPTFRQRSVARELIDGGADVVFGHHPHVLQGVEVHGAGLIAYSMGNFLFENASKIPKLTGVLRVRFESAGPGAGPGAGLGAAALPRGACLAGAEFYPAVMQRTPWHHPVPATGRDGRAVRARLIDLSRALAMRWREAAEPEAGPLTLETPATCRAQSAGEAG